MRKSYTFTKSIVSRFGLVTFMGHLSSPHQSDRFWRLLAFVWRSCILVPMGPCRHLRIGSAYSALGFGCWPVWVPSLKPCYSPSRSPVALFGSKSLFCPPVHRGTTVARSSRWVGDLTWSRDRGHRWSRNRFGRLSSIADLTILRRLSSWRSIWVEQLDNTLGSAIAAWSRKWCTGGRFL